MDENYQLNSSKYAQAGKGVFTFFLSPIILKNLFYFTKLKIKNNFSKYYQDSND